MRTWHDGGHSCRGARGERVSLRCYDYATVCVLVRARGGGGGGGERGGVAGAVHRWAVCLLLAGECCEGRRWFCLWPRQIGCLPFPESQGQTGTEIGRRQGSLHPVGACLLACLLALLCFDGGGWPRAGMMHRARHSGYYCCCRLNAECWMRCCWRARVVWHTRWAKKQQQAQTEKGSTGGPLVADT